MGEECSRNGKAEKCLQLFSKKNHEVRDLLADKNVYGKIMMIYVRGNRV